jgi:hypothetical protein
LAAVEDEIATFFKDATRDGEGVQNALDTLVEIQNFLASDAGASVAEMMEAINGNAADIEDLQDVVGDDKGGLVKDAADAKANIADLQSEVDALQVLTGGFAEGEENGAIKTAIEAAQTAADNAQRDLDILEGIVGESADKGLRADIAKNTSDIATLVGVVGDENSGLVAASNTYATKIADLEAEFGEGGRVTVAEAGIAAIEAVVNAEGGNSNAQLRADIEALEAIVVDGDDSNAELREEITRVSGLIEAENTGLQAVVAGHASRLTDAEDAIDEIEKDYLKEADWFIINCGTSVLRDGEPTA